MAITASMAVSPTTATRNLLVNCALTVSNSLATTVQILAITPIISATSGATSGSIPANWSQPILAGNQLYTVPPSGSVVVNFGLSTFAPAGPSGGFPATQTSEAYTVGAMVYTNDGAVTIASTASLTVNAPAYPGTTTTA